MTAPTIACMGMSLRAMNQYSKSFEEFKDESGKIVYG